MRFSLLGPAILAAALTLSACTPSAGGGTSPTSSPTAVAPPTGSTAISVGAQKALYLAEAAYNVPAEAYVALDAREALPAPIKARAKPLLLAAYQALQAARHAAVLGDSIGVLAAAGTATTQAQAAAAILPPAN